MYAPEPDAPTADPSTDPAEWSSRTLTAACVLTVALAFGAAAALAGLSESASGQQGFGPGRGQLPGQGPLSPLQQQNVPSRGRATPGPQQRAGHTPSGTSSNGSATS